MDLLGSILGNMAKPPSMSDKEKEKRKKERELANKMEEKQREFTKTFREKTERRIGEFLKQQESRRLEFSPMDKVQRSLVHDVAEVAGLVAHSFGEEDIDRHLVVWKKECAPCEGELECLKRGLDWDPVRWAEIKREEDRAAKEEEADGTKRKKKEKFVPKGSNYQEKYEHLIGKDSALEAARKTEMNKSYGMVSAEMKKDKRTVEDIQAELRAKKKMKLEQQRQQEDNS